MEQEGIMFNVILHSYDANPHRGTTTAVNQDWVVSLEATGMTKHESDKFMELLSLFLKDGL
jgi:hypothetical protein